MYWRGYPARTDENIPEAIHYLRELSLSGSWSGAYGPHLAFLASEDIPGNDHGGSAIQYLDANGCDMDAEKDKSAMRREYRRKRSEFVSSLGKQDMALAFSAAPTPFKSLFQHDGVRAKSVAAYYPSGSEASPLALLAHASMAGCTTALPHVTGKSTPMRFLKWSAENSLEKGAFGLMQPAADSDVIIPDIVLVPLVAFDRNLNRLGQGAGHYDRALSLIKDVYTIGIAWSVQEASFVHTDPWDIPMDAILTEREWITR